MRHDVFSGQIVKSPCPKCGKGLDGATAVSGKESPKMGDVTVCIYCATVLVFDHDLTLRYPTAKERHKVMGHPDVKRVLRAVHQSWSTNN